ncbi:hypothetical protein P8935_15315 [Telmatobacter sp. DSM 110680]|uniref:WG containing repeat-containing protein n=1 Tax=Telmatobacter sp. DSM 110680 TaxID=3036704 RepID=A0AAU7DFR8_9BACT
MTSKTETQSWLFRLIVGLTALAVAQPLFSQKIVIFDYPNSSDTHPTALNFKGEITGYYLASSTYHGFLRRPDGSFTSFDVPLPAGGFPSNAIPMDINDLGQITGFYAFEVQLRSFLRQPDGTIVQFEPPLSAPSRVTAQLQSNSYDKPICGGEDWWLSVAMNDAGQVVGSGPVSTAVASGFIRARDGSIKYFDAAPPSLGQQTCPQAINVWGQIVGYDNTFSAFLRERDGRITQFTLSDASETIPTAINFFGEVTGFYQDNTGFHGFIRHPNGVTISFDPAGSNATEPTAMNALGEITGFYSGMDGIAHSFLRKRNGTIISFDVQNSHGTFARSISLAGAITGEYFDGASYHGFIRKP